jgi:membrane-associated protease RseP (regulator of RpoE activity)
MKRRIVGSIFLLIASLTCPAQAEKRVALVVGNSAYRNVTPLDNPARDARLMADTLLSLGFTLIGGGAQLDLDKAGFDAAVQSFGNQLPGANVGLFYYAGHGVQVRGVNYLVPIGANPTKEADVDFQMLDSNLVLRQMEGAGTKLNIVVLDACRNNPFGGRGLRGTESGLAQMRAPEGTLISFATQPGNLAQDGTSGNSPYTKALAETIRRPGLDIFQTFNEVGLAVMQATGNSQQPWLSSSPIRGSFYFAGLTTSPATSEPAASPPSPPAVATLPPAPQAAPSSRPVAMARGWIGVRIQQVTDEVAEGLGVEPKGAIIADVDDGGPAKSAGLKVGDVIVGFDGKSVREAKELARLVGDTQPGANVEIVVLRKSNEIRKTISSGRPPTASPAKDAQSDKPSPVSPPPGTKTAKTLGLELASLTDRLREYYNVPSTTQGAVVTGAAQDARMVAGDVVREVSGTAVTNAADVQSRVEELKKSGRKMVLLLVTRHQSSRFVALRLGTVEPRDGSGSKTDFPVVK